MLQHPTGTVTFLFVDIESSTKLARDYPRAWPSAQRRALALCQEVISTHQGLIFQVIGDEFQAAFAAAQEALAAAMKVQQAFRAEDWGEIGSIRVRMGIHTGPAVPREDRYEGYLALSHTKRLMSTAYADQILLSEATEALIRDSLPEKTTLRNLGKHRLKDFEQPERIFQVVAPGLPSEFPPLKSLERPPVKLPAQLTSFIGRAKEVSDVIQMLLAERLVTLTGPGGSGKTRLAIQVAAQLAEEFQDGVFFVALATVTDPGLVASTIAQSLGIMEAPGRSIVDRLKEDLQEKSLLLLLDNFEQVILAAPLVSDLLLACAGLKVIVTSREGLRISGENEYPVPPLGLPDLARLPPLEALSRFASIELFYQRAKAVKPDFRITNESARTVAEICYRLDGLPLAIELAAARVKLLPPKGILARLEHRLEFLTSGARDLPQRQQTLRNAIAWSYDLLNESEKFLFRQLAVFVAGCSLEAIEAVAGDQPDLPSLFDRLSSLVDKSLLQELEGTNGEPRFTMLETLREYGVEQLEASGEQEIVRHRHASYYLAFIEQAETNLESAGQIQWMNQMEQEHGNLRAALEWARVAEGTADICLRLAGMLGLFWEARGYISEGRERLAAILSTDFAQGQTAARAALLTRAAELAYRQSDYAATIAYAKESLAIYRAVGDKKGIASALIKLGNAATEVGDFATAAEYLEEALATWRGMEDKHGITRALISLGWIALRTGDYPLAEARLVEALEVSRALQDTRRMGFELAGLGEIALRQGNYRRANQLVEESLELRRQLGNKWGVGVCLGILGWVAMYEKNWDKACQYLSESLDVRRDIGDQSGSAWCIERLAEVAMTQGQAVKAVRLFSAGAALRASIHSAVDPVDQPGYENMIRMLRGELGEEKYETAWQEGRAMSLDRAAAYSLEG